MKKGRERLPENGIRIDAKVKDGALDLSALWDLGVQLGVCYPNWRDRKPQKKEDQ